MGDVEKSQVEDKSRKRKLINSSKKMDKVEERKPARWAMDIDLSNINLSPHLGYNFQPSSTSVQPIWGS